MISVGINLPDHSLIFCMKETEPHEDLMRFHLVVRNSVDCVHCVANNGSICGKKVFFSCSWLKKNSSCVIVSRTVPATSVSD